MATAPGVAVASSRSGYMFGPLFDGFFIILAPVVAAAFWIAVSHSLLPVPLPGDHSPDQQTAFWSFIVFAFFTQGHLVLAFFRSHANRSVFSQFPVRFTVVPLLVFAAAVISPIALLCLAVLEVWWDVYHSSMQTFGFARIYDMKAGNAAQVGRRLDFWLSIVIYAGPIFATSALLAHVQPFEQFAFFRVFFLSRVPVELGTHLALINRAAVGLSVAYLIYYVAATRRLARTGYHVSPQKLSLLVSTAAVSLYAWYCCSFGGAFVITNLFHALQYYGFIYAHERSNLRRLLRLDASPLAAAIVVALIVCVGSNFGFFAATINRNVASANHWPWALAVTVALMHFWYDGFMWSVRKKQIDT
jgi:hypothetical protein